jgi:hypothetical protein
MVRLVVNAKFAFCTFQTAILWWLCLSCEGREVG